MNVLLLTANGLFLFFFFFCFMTMHFLFRVRREGLIEAERSVASFYGHLGT